MLDRLSVICLCLFVGFFSFVLGSVTHYFVGKPRHTVDRQTIEREATAAGVAYYELNAKTGQIEFHYVDINKLIQSVVSQLRTPNSAGVLQ